ncbi:uncharacterized protein LOC135940650 isoform X2 [Cloeon dipterum]|uniref:uncharacterized protein LOC135940650 isoform X2 n=1 Tax=Cloeon dipterum TaxID=197152 RepID=UPI00321F77DF
MHVDTSYTAAAVIVIILMMLRVVKLFLKICGLLRMDRLENLKQMNAAFSPGLRDRDKKINSEERFYKAPGYRQKTNPPLPQASSSSKGESQKSESEQKKDKKHDGKPPTETRSKESKATDTKKEAKKSPKSADKDDRADAKSSSKRSTRRRSSRVLEKSKGQTDHLTEKAEPKRDADSLQEKVAKPISAGCVDATGEAAQTQPEERDVKADTPKPTRENENSGRRSEGKKKSIDSTEATIIVETRKVMEPEEKAKPAVSSGELQMIQGEPLTTESKEKAKPAATSGELQMIQVEPLAPHPVDAKNVVDVLHSQYLELIASIEPPPEQPLEEKVEVNLQDHQRSYAQQYLAESAGMRYPSQQRGEKVVLDQEVMQDYRRVFNFWEHQNKKYSEAKEKESSVITVVDGDLFSATCSLAHCVSEDFRMSSGIAVPFRRRFGHVAELLNQRKTSGEVAVLKNGNRFIYYLVTKELYMSKPEGLFRIWQCLAAMREHAMLYGVQDIAMPKIGCGKDHMHWPDVANAIQTTFANTGIRITVYQMQSDPIPAVCWPQLPPLKRPAPFPPNLSTPPPAKRPNAECWLPAPQEPNSMRTLYVQHVLTSNILDARPPIVRIFLASSKSCPPEDSAAMLNATFKFWNEFMLKERLLGTNVPLFAGQINALVVRDDPKEMINYQALHKAAKDLAKMTSALGIQRLAIQGFSLPNDKMATFKVITILRLAMVNQSLTLFVHWSEDPPYAHLIRHYQQLHNQQSQQSQEQIVQPVLGPDEYDY